MRAYKDLILPMLLLSAITVVAIYFRPLLIIDETRYVSVAWEMFNSGSYFVPTLNGIPYDHKPPLLFWLINLDWHLFGVNETSIRFIPLLFSLGNIVLSYKIYKLLWKDDALGAKLLAWIIVGSVVYSFYTTLLMFDIMLSFWVLLALLGGIKAVLFNRFRDYALIAFAVGFGILAKSPVIVAHLLPLYIFAFWWAKGKVELGFYVKGLFAVVAGILIALIWAIPAAKMGGDSFAYGIFWGQYAGRAVNSFAHKHSFWWYIPWIPAILMPWFLSSAFWSGLKGIKLDLGAKFLITWLVGALVIFSVISGKQLHYIAPEFLAFFMLLARAISLAKVEVLRGKLAGFVHILIGVVFLAIPFFLKGYIRVFLDIKATTISGSLIIIYGLYLYLKKFETKEQFIKVLSISSLVILTAVHFSAHIYFNRQNLTNFSKEIAKLEKKGLRVAHFGKYHNQYRFLGRLMTPMVVIKTKEGLDSFIKANPNSAIVTYLKRDVKYNKDAVIAVTKFRTQNALLVKAKSWYKLK